LKPLRKMIAPFKVPSARTGMLGPYSLSRTRLPLVTQPVPRAVAAMNTTRGKQQLKRRIDIENLSLLLTNPLACNFQPGRTPPANDSARTSDFAVQHSPVQRWQQLENLKEFLGD
jgi:hypothetical protein